MKYFLESEVAQHSFPDDCWVSIFGSIYDLTELIRLNRGELTEPIIKNAGKSISHWFNEKTKDIRTFVDPEKEITLPYTPYERFVHVPPDKPVNNFEMVDLPWWKNESYVVGQVTRKQRMIMLFNVLTKQEDILNVCDEDNIERIRSRYLEYNQHASSYTWKALKGDTYVNLDMKLTLEENDIIDESIRLEQVELPDDLYIPTLFLYYNDDLTVA